MSTNDPPFGVVELKNYLEESFYFVRGVAAGEMPNFQDRQQAERLALMLNSAWKAFYTGTNIAILDSCVSSQDDSEAAKLRQAITDAGFAVMQTSGKWSIHDVSENAEFERKKTSELINHNIELEMACSEVITQLEGCDGLIKDSNDSKMIQVLRDAMDWKVRQ